MAPAPYWHSIIPVLSKMYTKQSFSNSLLPLGCSVERESALGVVSCKRAKMALYKRALGPSPSLSSNRACSPAAHSLTTKHRKDSSVASKSQGLEDELSNPAVPKPAQDVFWPSFQLFSFEKRQSIWEVCTDSTVIQDLPVINVLVHSLCLFLSINIYTLFFPRTLCE